jgi:hypothetical protein
MPRLIALDREGVPALAITPRMRSQLVYFQASPGKEGVPEAGSPDEVVFCMGEVRRWLEEGVFEVVSPLDTANQTEIELTEEQEAFLGWLLEHGVSHVRVEG